MQVGQTWEEIGWAETPVGQAGVLIALWFAKDGSDLGVSPIPLWDQI